MVSKATTVGAAVADRQHHWVDRLPATWRDYAVLARLDRPIGTWLLLLPCWWGLALPTPAAEPLRLVWLGLLMAIGAMAMRGAGCTINDMVDRQFDAMVERTRQRPLAAGRVSVRAAALFVGLQCLVGLLVLLMLPPFAVLVGFLSVPLIVVYPFMKRITWWPQFVLGLAFNWGVLVGVAAVTGTLGQGALVLYAAGIAWTLGYDTIYAHQDKADDALIGVRSTARLFGERTKPWLAAFYATSVGLVGLAGAIEGKGWPFWLLLALAGGHLARQIAVLEPDRPASCLDQFRANRLTGLIIAAALLAGSFWR
jgi:4-hydroxybenzoate polyprenyltransferase